MKRMQKFLALFSLVFVLGAGLNSPAHAGADDNSNFRFGPILLIVGLVDVSMDFAVAPNWTVGPTLKYWHFNLSSDASLSTDYTIDAIAGGVRANWFNNGIYTDGLYVGPSVSLTSIKIKSSDSTGTSTSSGTVPVLQTVVGYAWFWESFNMMLGGGLSVPVGSDTLKIRSSTGEEEVKFSRTGSLALEYTLGWTF